jgi:hypothetical protein
MAYEIWSRCYGGSGGRCFASDSYKVPADLAGTEEEGMIFSMFAINTSVTPVSTNDGLSWKDNPIDTCTWIMLAGTAILSVNYKITITDNIITLSISWSHMSSDKC